MTEKNAPATRTIWTDFEEMETNPQARSRVATQIIELQRRAGTAERRAASAETKLEHLEDRRLRGIRRQLVGELKKLVPTAVTDAKGGKPALLRLVLRAIRIR